MTKATARAGGCWVQRLGQRWAHIQRASSAPASAKPAKAAVVIAVTVKRYHHGHSISLRRPMNVTMQGDKRQIKTSMMANHQECFEPPRMPPMRARMQRRAKMTADVTQARRNRLLLPMGFRCAQLAQRKSSVPAVPGWTGVPKVREVWKGMADTLRLN